MLLLSKNCQKTWYEPCVFHRVLLYINVTNNESNMRKQTLKTTYWVDWYTPGGFCYRSTHGVTMEQVREMKKIAKVLGETIKYEKE